jgi:hypothetical protein
MKCAPIVLFVYNRPDHTLRVLEALQANTLASQSDLYIYCDGPKVAASDNDILAISKVREVLRMRKWCRHVEVVEFDYNRGLSDSIINGVSSVLERHDRVIVLEDDILTDPMFLSFMNDALNKLVDKEDVLSISSYNFFASAPQIPETFYFHVIDCWGWATWRRGWKLFEPDGSKLLMEIERKGLSEKFNVYGAYDYLGMLKNTIAKNVDSWAIRWYASGLIHDKLSLYPKKSLIQNIGFDGTGINSGTIRFDAVRSVDNQKIPCIGTSLIKNDSQATEDFKKYFRARNRGSLLQRILYRLIPNYVKR